MKKIGDFFRSENTPRWQILLGGFFVISIGLLQSEIYYQRALEDTEVSIQQQRIDAKVLEIQQNSIDFQTFANSYVTAILDGTTEVAQRRNLLVDNILAQDAAVDVSRNILDESIQPQIIAYRHALRNMKAAVERTNDVISMGQFWIAASDLLVARNSLLDALEIYSRNFGT